MLFEALDRAYSLVSPPVAITVAPAATSSSAPSPSAKPSAPRTEPSCTTRSVIATLPNARTPAVLPTRLRKVPATAGPVFRKST